MNIAFGTLTRTVEDIFVRSGILPEQAAAMARVIAAGERDACKSHGIYRIAGCLRTLKAGKVAPMARPALRDDGSAILRVDAGGGFPARGSSWAHRLWPNAPKRWAWRRWSSTTARISQPFGPRWRR